MTQEETKSKVIRTAMALKFLKSVDEIKDVHINANEENREFFEQVEAALNVATKYDLPTSYDLENLIKGFGKEEEEEEALGQDISEIDAIKEFVTEFAEMSIETLEEILEENVGLLKTVASHEKAIIYLLKKEMERI